jgi:hypothetical protein
MLVLSAPATDKENNHIGRLAYDQAVTEGQRALPRPQ